jgi:2-dehydro-3-deoxyphosphooctonate aldolase (KDO 8-P synthase)
MTRPAHPRTIGEVEFGSGRLGLIAGPCLAESLELCLRVARELKAACCEAGVGLVFKASFDKANRTSAASKRGPGLKTGLEWLAEVRRQVQVPVTSDVHEVCQVAPAAEVLDAIQIPAFLCRQTDLLVEAARSRRTVNIKKGQFMAPWDMASAVEKVRKAGNPNVLLTERGSSFGYNRLVSDMRAIPCMRAWAPVVFDATHSIQEPAGQGSASGGQRQYAPTLAFSALAAGADGLFVETHPDPDRAHSDAACQVPLEEMPALIGRARAFFDLARQPM